MSATAVSRKVPLHTFASGDQIVVSVLRECGKADVRHGPGVAVAGQRHALARSIGGHVVRERVVVGCLLGSGGRDLEVGRGSNV